MPKMGLQFGLDKGQFCKRQHHWLFEIPNVCADDSPNGSVNALPPEKSARPSISFKEMEARHLNEDIYYPAKPEWKPIRITLYDLQKKMHPVWNWLVQLYEPIHGKFYPSNENDFIKECFLKLYNGCGEVIETWLFEDCWPQAIDFQTLDMSQTGVLMCDITLRYARAYIYEPN